MISDRDGHVRVLPIHVANKIAAGEVVERPASVVKELVENAIDAGAKSIRIAITAGGRKLVSVQDDGCGMTRDDAVLSLERQATSKILDVTDIEQIDTLGFRGEAIPSIASVSRFSLVTRRRDTDEGTLVEVNAGTLADVRATGCPPGTRVEVRDLFCNVPARRKFLRAYATEEAHVRQVFTVHALAHPEIGFALNVDGRDVAQLAPSAALADRVRDLFGEAFAESLLALPEPDAAAEVRVSGYVERPNLSTPTRREQYVFVNGRPATAPSVNYALREAYPRRAGETRPATILFIRLPPGQVDVNVHPTKREVRFRDNAAIKSALAEALGRAFAPPPAVPEASPATPREVIRPEPRVVSEAEAIALSASVTRETPPAVTREPPVMPEPSPVQVEFDVAPPSERSRPWKWFNFLAQTSTGYLLAETDEGIVTINPVAARERIVFERLTPRPNADGTRPTPLSQALLLPETVRVSPAGYARLAATLDVIRDMGFQIEPFGGNTYKVEAVPQIVGNAPVAALLETIAHDLEGGSSRKSGERWREELVAKAVARSFAGATTALTREGATQLIEDLSACRMPYVCPRGKRILLFTSTRELDRKFDR